VSFDQSRLRKHGAEREKAQRSSSSVTNLASVGWENPEKYRISILMEANATCCEVMHRVDQVPQIAAKPVHLSNETDLGFKERSLNLLAQGQALTRTRLCDLLAVKNERPGEVP
jgi:hypothetical protein